MKFLRTKRGLLAQALGAVMALHASGASALDLMQAYEAALKNDPQYRAAIYANEAGAENRILGRSGLLPSLSASVSGSKNKSDITTTTTRHEDYTSKSTVLQLRQPVVNFDALARYKQGVLQSELASVAFLGEGQQVALRVLGAYVDLLFRQDQLDVAVRERDMFIERMKVNDRLFTKGEGTRTDMLETRARLDVAEAAVLEAQDAVASARTTLEGVIGGPVDQVAPLGAQFNLRKPETQSFDSWLQKAKENNFEIQSRRLGVDISQQEINKQRAGHYPRLDVVASLSNSKSESITTINQDYKTKSVGFQLNIPIYNGGAVSASTRQAVANRERAKAELQAETDKQTLELRKDYDQLVSSAARITALEKAVESGKLLVTATEQSIRGGVRINLDLLDAQRQLSVTLRDLAQARYTYILAYVKLRAAAGMLQRDDVREMAAYFR
nr:TolC family outer membrane protein [Pseudoduganella ginsengisoli]